MIGRDVKQFSGDSDEGVRWWFTQLDRGIKRRRREEKRWDLYESFANGKQWWDGETKLDYGGGDQVTVNKVRSYINTHRASVAFKNPVAKFTPRTPSGYEPIQVPVMGQDGTPQTDQMGQVVTRGVIPSKARENLFNDIISQPLFGLAQMIDRADQAAILGYGAAMVGYRPMFETAPKTEGEQMIPVGPDGQLDFSDYKLNQVTGLPVEDADGRLIRKSHLPVWEEWFIDWVSYRDIIIDPDGENDFMRHRWVAIEEVRYLDDVKADPLFENTEELQATGDYDGEDHRRLFEEWLEGEDEEDKAKLVRLFHVYDFVKDKYLVLADGHGKALSDKTTPSGITHSPLAMLRYQEILGEFYNHPKAADLVPINQWYNNSRRMEYIGSKASIRKPIIAKGKFDTANLDKLKSDVDMEFVFMNQDSAYPGESPISVFTPPPVNPSVYRASAAANADFDEMAGSPEARGVASADTATQSNNLKEGEDARNSYERVQMKNWLVVLFKKLNDSIDANMTVERAVEIEDVEGQVFTALVDQDMIAGDFDIEIDVQEMAPTNSMQSAAMKQQLWTTLGQTPFLASNEVLARGICEDVGIKDENFIKALVQAAQMQIAMLQAQAQPTVPEADAPKDEAQAVSQTGAGTQTRSMRQAK